MIVRIMGEGQVSLDDSHLATLNELDDELMSELDSGDTEGFRRTLAALLEAVRTRGKPLPDDFLQPSELILPSSEATIEEVRAMLTEDGLVPGPVPGAASGDEPGAAPGTSGDVTR